MLDHQVIDILKTFSAEEVKQFRRFLNSPYFNRSENVTSVFELLIKFHPNFTGKKLTKEYISENIFNSEKYNDSTVRNLLADLQESIELFMLQENFRKSALTSFDYLLKELREKKLSRVFERNYDKLERQFKEVKNVDSEYYLAKYKFELNKFNFFALNEKVADTKNVDKHFDEIFNMGIYITIHYMIEIISIYLTSIFYAINYNRPVTNSFFSKLVKTINLEGLEKLISDSEHNFLVRIYVALVKIFENIDDEVAYKKYRDLVVQNISKMGSDEIWFHYDNMMNYLTLKIMKAGNPEAERYNKELFDIHEEVLKNEYYKTEKCNYLRFDYFREILLVGLKLKKMNWVENFIITQSPKLHKSDKDNMMNLAYTYLYYEKGEHMKSWKYLNKINLEYFLFKYDIKNYALKIYFDLGHYEEALCLLENYRKFIERSELTPDSEKSRIKNFISFLTKLILFNVGQLPQKHFSTYRRRLEIANDTINHKWLLQKYDEQVNKNKESKISKSA